MRIAPPLFGEHRWRMWQMIYFWTLSSCCETLLIISIIPMEGNLNIAQQWIAGFNTKDLDGLLALYDANAQHFSPKLKARLPETKGLIVGHAAMREWWHDAFTRLPLLHYAPRQFTIQDNRVFIEYIRQTPGEEDMDVAEYLEIEHGKIVRSRVYHG